MKLYHELASWWPLLSPPEDYKEEAELYWHLLTKYGADLSTGLELGSGGGHNAFHFKNHCQLTLSDLSQDMLSMSEKLNPECKHVQADMREIDLQQRFDFVFIHDAISHMLSKADLAKVFSCAAQHLDRGGILLVTPDDFAETFEPNTDHGGIDGQGKGMRYLEWSSDRDPNDEIAEVDMVYVLKDKDGKLQIEHDHYEFGLFSIKDWQRLIEEAGFAVFTEPVELEGFPPGKLKAFVGIKQ